MPIEQLASEFERIVASGQDIEELASGFGSDMGPAEGPVWWQEGGYLLFSDIGHNRRMKWLPGQAVTLFHEPTNRANVLVRSWVLPKGLAFSPDESIFYINDSRRRGQQPEVKTSGKRKGYKVFGAIDYFSGRLFSQGIEGRFTSYRATDHLCL